MMTSDGNLAVANPGLSLPMQTEARQGAQGFL
jgi:hypothetical protein